MLFRSLQEPHPIGWDERRHSLPPHNVMDVPYFDIDNLRIWGATAMVLAEFLALVGELDP